MANTYTQIQIHFVFAVKYRLAQIDSAWKDDLHKYITGIVQNHKHKMLAINSVSDHIHLLVGLKPVQSISDLMENVKSDSSEWINTNKISTNHFNWQLGYSAFSVSTMGVKNVIKYILDQEQHHKKKSFKEEYLTLLQENEIDYDEKYIFRDLE